MVSFTGSPDESWFFAVPAAIEARGAPIITLALRAFESVSSNDSEGVVDCLDQISLHLDGCARLLPRMYERNNPSVFYNRIRPFLSGTHVPPRFPHGVIYEDEDGGGEYRRYKGPTAAQSSLWHFVDIALCVMHQRTDVQDTNGHADESPISSGQDNEFLTVCASLHVSLPKTCSC